MSALLTVPPNNWRAAQRFPQGMVWVDRMRNFKVIRAVEEHCDGKQWLHVSVSHPSRILSYYEFKQVKLDFMGDLRAFQIFPPEKEFVNIHENCLHLWACLEGDPLPDFDLEAQS